MQKPAEPIALFDMDGTLADYDAAMQRDMRLIASPNEPQLPSHRDGAPEYIKTRMNMIRTQPGWWHNLEKYPPGFEILNEAKALKFQCSVLTKGPKHAVAAWTEKATWCANHVPDMSITIAQDKGLVYGKVLVDDWPDYVTRWLEWRPRGLVIMPAHPWNEGYVHKNVIKYHGPKNLDEVRAALATVRATCGD
jgi:FMN phosphatase YigB (HAD superfamily)